MKNCILIRAGYDPYASLESIQVVRDHDNFGEIKREQTHNLSWDLGQSPAHTKRLNEHISVEGHNLFGS